MLKVLLRRQKHTAKIIYNNENRYTHAEPLLKDMNALSVYPWRSVYQINVHQTLYFNF